MEHGGHARAVFVDPSGRRHRLVVRAAWTLAGLLSAYVGLVVVSLLLPPSVSRLAVPGLGPVLPGPGAAPLAGPEGEEQRPQVLLARSPSPAPPRPIGSPSASTRGQGPRVSPTADRSPSPAPAPGAASPTPSPSAPPGPPERPSTAPSTPPGQSQPPGQASRSPRPRPTPSRGPR